MIKVFSHLRHTVMLLCSIEPLAPQPWSCVLNCQTNIPKLWCTSSS